VILLDTDHLSVFTNERDSRHRLLNSRMEAAEEQVACTIVNVEEMLRGWLALIHGLRDVHRQRCNAIPIPSGGGAASLPRTSALGRRSRVAGGTPCRSGVPIKARGFRLAMGRSMELVVLKVGCSFERDADRPPSEIKRKGLRHSEP